MHRHSQRFYILQYILNLSSLKLNNISIVITFRKWCFININPSKSENLDFLTTYKTGRSQINNTEKKEKHTAKES